MPVKNWSEVTRCWSHFMTLFFFYKSNSKSEKLQGGSQQFYTKLFTNIRDSLQGRELTEEHFAPGGSGHTHSEWPNCCQALRSTYSHRYKCFWLQFYWTNFKPLKHPAFKSTELLGWQQSQLPNSSAVVAILGVTGDSMALAEVLGPVQMGGDEGPSYNAGCVIYIKWQIFSQIPNHSPSQSGWITYIKNKQSLQKKFLVSHVGNDIVKIVSLPVCWDGGSPPDVLLPLWVGVARRAPCHQSRCRKQQHCHKKAASYMWVGEGPFTSNNLWVSWFFHLRKLHILDCW